MNKANFNISLKRTNNGQDNFILRLLSPAKLLNDDEVQQP